MLMTATLDKFTQGAWFPFMVAVVMTFFMSFWRWGMTKKRAYELDRRIRLQDLLRQESLVSDSKKSEAAFVLSDGNSFSKAGAPEYVTSTNPLIERPGSSKSIDSMAINLVRSSSSPASGLRRRQLLLREFDIPVARLPGISIYYTSAAMSRSHAPCTFRHLLEHFPALHSTCIFLHVRTAAQPHVEGAETLGLEPSPVWDGVWHGVYRVGYMETPDFTTEEFVSAIFAKLGIPTAPLTHVLQRTTLQAKKPKEIKSFRAWIKTIPARIRAWSIEVVWTGIDEAIGGVGKGWNVPVEDVVSVGSVAKV